MRIRSKKARPEEPIEAFLPTYREDGHVESPFVAWPDAPEERLDRARLCGLVRSATMRVMRSRPSTTAVCAPKASYNFV